ncbi:hypothetical protein TNIN_458601 [Trichonephila inaurata madagascariensis]|uniref:Uncharacterized protein n=1 Tax=Trichonephila inaurata madagascariensis TaxID=2747483 RepID=A0A8X6Y0U7_9ARAC|nr:hypothetical protein TNIN_458601 [Trichonephila inaurata madagascariensis]
MKGVKLIHRANNYGIEWPFSRPNHWDNPEQGKDTDEFQANENSQSNRHVIFVSNSHPVQNGMEGDKHFFLSLSYGELEFASGTEASFPEITFPLPVLRMGSLFYKIE